VLAVLAAEFSRTMRSPYPRLRAVEALLTAGPLFIVLFAAAHFVIGQRDASGYSEPMTRLDALYFTVTTFATVGYGDISPASQIARLVALVQMV
jgi:voltage-gated potassium channel